MSSQENDFFRGLPKDKETGKNKNEGICQIDEKSSSKKVVIDSGCRSCKIGKCMMFKAVVDKAGNVVGREFTPHESEY